MSTRLLVFKSSNGTWCIAVPPGRVVFRAGSAAEVRAFARGWYDEKTGRPGRFYRYWSELVAIAQPLSS